MTSRSLRLAPDARSALLAHARAGASADPPAEVCGVLGGRAGDPVRVEAVRRVPNVAADPTARYELDPAEAVRGIDAVEAAGDHVGFYHSHPRGPAVPSAVDRAEARWPGFVYAVVVPDGSVGAWRDTGDGLEPLTVRVDADG